MQDSHEHNVGWQVSLNNGETFFDGKGDFRYIPNGLSSWQRLVKYTVEKKCLITSLSLYTLDGRTFNLPSLGKNPNFKAFTMLPPPTDFRYEHTLPYTIGDFTVDEVKILNTPEGKELLKTKEVVKEKDLYAVAVAVYSNFELQLWVGENNTKNSWVVVKPTK